MNRSEGFSNAMGISEISSLALAYVGDAVFELFIRSRIVGSGKKVSGLHKEATAYVRASAQAHIFRELEAKLTQEEKAIANTARNAKVNTVPKNASIMDYHLSTGFEALLGHLYLTGDVKRLEELLEISYNAIEA